MGHIFPRLGVSSWRPWSSARGCLALTIQTPSSSMWVLQKNTQKNTVFSRWEVWLSHHLFCIFRPSWVCMHLLEAKTSWPRNVSSGLVYWHSRSTERTIHTSQQWMQVTFHTLDCVYPLRFYVIYRLQPQVHILYFIFKDSGHTWI